MEVMDGQKYSGEGLVLAILKFADYYLKVYGYYLKFHNILLSQTCLEKEESIKLSIPQRVNPR